jgi:hydrogenase/urease accessory protein HupE
MLIFALVVFTLVAIIGLGLFFDVLKGVKGDTLLPFVHAGFALLGSLLVIVTALEGNDTRLFINIGLAVFVIALGLLLSYKRRKGALPKGLAAAHGGLAVICYLLLAYNAFVPAA